MTLVTVGLFFAGRPIAVVALIAAGVLLLGRVPPAEVFRSVDWPLLVMVGAKIRAWKNVDSENR